MVALSAWRIREGRFFGVVGCFMWVPMIVWVFALTGIDIVAARPWFVVLNLLVALVCLGGYVIVSRALKTPEGAAARQARERLDEVVRFTDPIRQKSCRKSRLQKVQSALISYRVDRGILERQD